MTRSRLLELLRSQSYERRRVVLASGRESDFFIDCKRTVLRAEGHALVAEVMGACVDERAPEAVAVAGVALGGCALASAVALRSHLRGRPRDAIYVRKEAKAHGSARRIEGAEHLAVGAPVVVLEDVVTSGGSTLDCVAALRAAGLAVARVIALVDRGEGGADAIRAEGCAFESIYGRDEFPS